MYSLQAISEQPLTKLKSTVESKGNGAAKWAHLSSDLYTKKLGESTLAGVEKSVALLKSVESKTFNAEDERILQWVSKADYSNLQKVNQGLRHGGTGKWILSSEPYQTWKSSPGSILWLPGIVGCGKSVLCSTVIQDIEQLCQEDKSKCVAYWYFKFDNDETKSVENLIRSLIRQFSRKPLQPSVRKVWEENSPRGSQPDRNLVSTILEDVLSNSAGEMFLVLDALDECPGDPSGERERLLSLLVGLVERHKEKLHIMATSRPEKDIHAQLVNFPTVDLQEKLAQDVETFVRARVGEGSLKNLDEGFQNRIVDSLLCTGERRFRWAALQMARLEAARTNKLLEKALLTIPKTLEDTYRDVLNRLNEDEQDLALSMLRLMCVATVPLDLNTVANAASLRIPDDVVTICSSSLVTANEENTVRLAHFSVKEFLMVHDPLKKDHWCRFLDTEAHAALVTETVDLLIKQDKELKEEDTIGNPFLVYAARNFHTHVAGMGGITPDLQNKIDRLFTEPNIYFNYIRMVPTNYRPASSPWLKTPGELLAALFRATDLGFKHTVELLVAQRADPLTFDHSDMCHAFKTAALGGHVEIMEFLLGQDLQVPLPVAVDILESINVCRKIGDEKLKAVFNILWNRGGFRGESADAVHADIVFTIASNSECGFELAQLLLARSDEVLIRVKDSTFMFMQRIQNHQADTVELFFEKCNDNIEITRNSLLYFCRGPMRADMLGVVIRRRAAELPLDEEIVSKLVTTADWASMEALFEVRRNEIPVTEGLLIKAAGNAYGADMIRFLFNKRAPGVEISEEVFIEAARQSQNGDILECLLDELAPDASLTENIIQTIVENGALGLKMMNDTLARQQPGFVVSESIIERAVSRECEAVEMLQLLMNNGGSDVPITENLVIKAAQNHSLAHSLIKMLLELLENAFPITDSVIIALAKNPSHGAAEALQEMLKRFPDAGMPEEAVQAASKNLSMVPMLIDRAPSQVSIEKVLEQIATQKDYSKKMDAARIVKPLIDRQFVNVNETVVEALAPNPCALQIIFKYIPDAPVTERALVRAASHSLNLKLLVEKLKDPTVITEEVMLAAVRDYLEGEENIMIIFDRLGSLPITPTVCKEAALQTRRNKLRLILRLQKDLKPRVLLQGIWQDSHTDAETKATVTMAFLEIADAEDAIAILQNYPYHWEQKKDHGFDNLIQELLPDNIPSQKTDKVAMMIMERCSNEVIEKFLETDHRLPITEKLTKAAERNPRADKEALLSLLAEKRESA